MSEQTGRPVMLFNIAGEVVRRAQDVTLWGQPATPATGGYEPPRQREDEESDPGLLYAGQWRDGESGLCYNRFRYYEPESGMYLVSDPLGVFGGVNTYSYVTNPLEWVDPFGLAGCYREVYFNVFKRMEKFIGKGTIEIHHRIPQMYIGNGKLFPEAMRTSLSNLQGLPRNVYRQIVSPAWATFRKQFPNATRAQIVKKAMDIDKLIAEYINRVN